MFENLLETKNCACGRNHVLTTKEYIVKKDAMSELAPMLKKLNISNPLFVFDENTYKAASYKIEIPNFKKIILTGSYVAPNEENIEKVESTLKQGYDCAIAVGAGVICDISRYAAFKLSIPFIAAPTAASVDGFVSDSAVVTLKGAKHTFPAKPPIAVVADLEIISKAPKKLSAAGVGDMLSKYISIADWKIGHLVTGEYYCPYVAQLTKDAVDSIVNSIDDIEKGDLEGMGKLMYGLILSGIGMQMIKITRSASSFEHHYSHFLEIIQYHNVDKYALHGEKVGVGTLIAAKYFLTFTKQLERIFTENIANKFNIDKIINIYSKFGDFTKEMLIHENTPTITQSLNVEMLKENFNKVIAVAGEVPDYKKLEAALIKMGGYTSYTQLNLNEDENREVMSLCCYIRNRFTMLRVVCDYDLFDFTQSTFNLQ